jgi:hypothetical protein
MVYNRLNVIGKYCYIYINKFLLQIGSKYGVIHISDIDSFKQSLDEPSKDMLDLITLEYNTLIDQFDVNKITQDYHTIFTKNILDIPYDLISIEIIQKCNINADEWLKKMDNNELLLLPCDKIELRTNLIQLERDLALFLKIKTLEKQMVGLFSSINSE